jgi:hypothetical protein
MAMMLTCERLGGMHDNTGEINHHNVMFNPSIMMKSMHHQYMQHLHQLGIYLVRAIVIQTPSHTDHYGDGVRFAFTEAQQQNAHKLCKSARAVLAPSLFGFREESLDTIAEDLHQLALSVLFADCQTAGSGFWDGAWRKFFAFGNMNQHQ